MTDSRAIIRSAGLKATPVRARVLDVLRHTKKPLSVADVASSVKADVASVYRNLNILKEAGLIERLMIAPDRAYFEYVRSHHHHLVCTSCGKIAELSECSVGNIKKLKVPNMFAQVFSHRLEFFGLCRVCHNA